MFSKNATIIDEIFTMNLTICSKCQINGEDFVDFCGLLRIQKLYTYGYGVLFNELADLVDLMDHLKLPDLELPDLDLAT